MGRPTLDEDKELFLATLREQEGGKCGNYRLKDELLKWLNDRYWRTHSTVLAEGLVVRGPGQGGTVRLVEQTVKFDENTSVTSIAQASEQIAAVYRREADLYPLCQKVIGEEWSRERAYDDYLVEVTAQPGNVLTGGTWTRPDISLLGTRSYPYLPGRYFEIATFEVKTADAIDVKGVFEALSHAQFATWANVIFLQTVRTSNNAVTPNA